MKKLKELSRENVPKVSTIFRVQVVAGKSEDGLVLGSGGEEQSLEEGFNTKFQE